MENSASENKSWLIMTMLSDMNAFCSIEYLAAGLI